MKVALISASIGDFDTPTEHITQTVAYDHHHFNDENFPPRVKSMTPRLQAKIPKCFGWQLAPGYDRYMWIDGNLTLTHPESLQYFINATNDYDVAVLQHPRRNTVKWESRYLYRGLKDQSNYMVGRYSAEHWEDQMAEINADKNFVDDLLVLGGVFMYKNTPEVRQTLKEWWYHISRYLIMDQLSWSYVLKQSGLKINVLPDIYNDCPWLAHRGHKRRA